MSDLNSQPENKKVQSENKKSQSENNCESPEAKKKCCGKIKNFFTKETQDGKRVLNWKFGVLVVVIIVLVIWLI